MKKIIIILGFLMIGILSFGQSWVPVNYNMKLNGQGWFTKNTLFSDLSRFTDTTAWGNLTDSINIFSESGNLSIEKNNTFNTTYSNIKLSESGIYGNILMHTKDYGIKIDQDPAAVSTIELTGNALFNNKLTVTDTATFNSRVISNSSLYVAGISHQVGDVTMDNDLYLTDSITSGTSKTGKIYSTGNAQVDGNTILGNANTDSLTINARVKTLNKVEITYYGAIGDGVTNNATAIQNCANYCMANNVVMVIPKGNFLINSTITINDTITIEGYGYNSVIRSNSAITLFTVTVGNKSVFTNFRMVGNLSVVNSGISLDIITGCRIDKLWCDSLGEKGVYFKGINVVSDHRGNQITNCYFKKCKKGIYIDNRNEYDIIDNCYVLLSTSIGIYSAAGNTSIYNTTVVDGDYGIFIDAGTNDSHSTISNCVSNHNVTNLKVGAVTIGLLVNNCQLFSGIVVLLTSQGVSFNNCEFGTITFRFDGSYGTNFNNCKYNTGNTFTEDYNAHTSWTTYTNNTTITNKIAPYIYQSSLTNAVNPTIYAINNKSGDSLLTIGNTGIVTLTGNLKLKTSQTTVNGSAGTAIWSQPFQGSSYKKFLVYLTGYTQVGGDVITFPTAFSKTPYVYGDAVATAIAVTTTTTCTITTAAPITGLIIIEGY